MGRNLTRWVSVPVRATLFALGPLGVVGTGAPDGTPRVVETGPLLPAEGAFDGYWVGSGFGVWERRES